MKKSTIKAFTLVEMFILIVIIGIFIASLMPRMQQAQSRARDVTRKNDLAQMWIALTSFYNDYGKLPDCINGSYGGSIDSYNKSCYVDENQFVQEALKAGGLDVVPKDPLGRHYIYGLNMKDGRPFKGFYLAANTEVAGVSNFVVGDKNQAPNEIAGKIADTATFEPCKTIREAKSGETTSWSDAGDCIGGLGSFRYVVTY